MDKIFDILVSKFGSDLISLAEKSYLEEPRGRYKSNPMPVIKPQNTKQVSEIICFCNENNIGVIPYAGGTGLVGGQTVKSEKDMVLLSVERMQSIRNVLPDENKSKNNKKLIFFEIIIKLINNFFPKFQQYFQMSYIFFRSAITSLFLYIF